MALSVLIIDNNIELCDFLEEFIDSQSDFSVIGQAHDGQSGLDQIRKHRPDIVILDITMPKMDGLEVLEHLQRTGTEAMPRILVVTAFGREEVLQQMRQMGVQQILLKPFTLETLLLRLRELYGNVISVESQSVQEVDRETLEAEITNALLELGIPSHFKGFHYLKESVLLSVTKGYFGGSLGSGLYPPIAARFDTTPGGVEAAIRNSVSYAWDNGNQSSLRKLCGTYQGDRVPTNALVIACLAEWMRSYRLAKLLD